MTNGAMNQPTWALGIAGFAAMQEYWRDTFERSILFLDVLRQRGNNYVERTEETAPHVLTFKAEVLIDGYAYGSLSMTSYTLDFDDTNHPAYAHPTAVIASAMGPTQHVIVDQTICSACGAENEFPLELRA